MHIMGKIRVFMEHNRMLKGLVPVIRRMKVMSLLHSITLTTKDESTIKKFNELYEKRMDQFDKVLELLSDKKSIEIYKSIIKFRRTYGIKSLKGVVSYPQYFVEDIFGSYENEVFVDGGAYTGDTITALLKYASRGGIQKIYAWEPDQENAKMLLKIHGKRNDVILIPCALYNEKTVLNFSNIGGGTSSIGGFEGVRINADSIDARCTDATFIKMDIEGAEMDALYGAKETIIRNKPKLAICIYHKPEHLYEIPLLIHTWVPEYKIYIRHHSDRESESVVYAKV